jgi:hypothetical protein
MRAHAFESTAVDKQRRRNPSGTTTTKAHRINQAKRILIERLQSFTL